MKVELWAKKLGGKGHVFLNVAEIPDGKRTWLVPVRQPISVVVQDGGQMTPPHPTVAVREFRMVYAPFNHAVGSTPKFLET
jgi:hypothetical protein